MTAKRAAIKSPTTQRQTMITDSSKKSDVNTPDEFDILPAIWILASNDENNLISVEGVKYRLNLNASYNVASLIRKRGDLFRMGAPSEELDSWKQAMLGGSKLPSYIRVMKGPHEPAINSIDKTNVFRSQFRVEKDAPKSKIEIIEWGLGYIERLRTAKADRDAKKYAWWKDGVLPTISALVALGSVCVVYFSIVQEKKNVQFQVTSIPKQQAYTAFSSALDDCITKLTASQIGPNSQLGSAEQSLDVALYSLRSLLSDPDYKQLQKSVEIYRSFLDDEHKLEQGSTAGHMIFNYEKAFQIGNPMRANMKEALSGFLFSKTG